MRGSISAVRRRAEAADAALALRQLVDLDELDRRALGRTTSCAIRIPGSTTNVSRAVGVQEVDQQLAAIAGVDEPGRVDDRDPVLRGQARARLDEAGVAVRDRDREAGRRRARAPPARARPARRPTGRAPRRRVGARRHDGLRPQPAGSAARSGGLLPARRGVGDEERREARQVAARQPRDDEHAVGRVLALLDRRAERVELRQPAALVVTARAGAPAPSRSSNRRASSAWSSSSPSPSRADTCGAPGKRFCSRRRPSGSTRSILFSTSSTGSSPAPISCRTSSTASRWRSCSSSGAEASTTCSTMSATSVSSSVDANPSTSWCGSRRMKPTVSVTR